jgi:2'-5' RNA ligase
MPLFVLAIPELSGADAARINAIRSAHDPQHGPVAPHVTLVFGTDALNAAGLEGHVRAAVSAEHAFDVVFRAAMPYPERAGSSEAGEYSYVFLVPDEGNSRLVRLHDALYAGPLAAERRLDLPYISHVTLARATLPRATVLAADWKANEPPIQGHVDGLNIVELEGGQLIERARIPLAQVP